MGSEMCIRDRAEPGDDRPLHVGVAEHADAVAHDHPTVADAPDACLLYTSDAADDLLCVDLGGRRIIKKQN